MASKLVPPYLSDSLEALKKRGIPKCIPCFIVTALECAVLAGTDQRGYPRKYALHTGPECCRRLDDRGAADRCVREDQEPCRGPEPVP